MTEEHRTPNKHDLNYACEKFASAAGCVETALSFAPNFPGGPEALQEYSAGRPPLTREQLERGTEEQRRVAIAREVIADRLRAELAIAATEIGPVSEKDLPPEVLPAFRQLTTRMKWRDHSAEATLATVSDGEVEAIGRLIVDVHRALQKAGEH